MLAFLAVLAGGFIAIQAGINSQLGALLKNPLLATAVAFLLSATVSSISVILYSKKLPSWQTVTHIPAYLWFGGFISALGVGLFYFLIPKMGVGPMMSLALAGQLVVAILLSHWGVFGLPIVTITPIKLLGILSLVGGITLINW
ncbi:DMT family transporter [Alteromonadaceae bacterium BrNp21-10]|nr:DMT family transporter [Alteromonadaceae bacterium BrNp21-10]